MLLSYSSSVCKEGVPQHLHFDEPSQPISDASGSGRVSGEEVEGKAGPSRTVSTVELPIKGSLPPFSRSQHGRESAFLRILGNKLHFKTRQVLVLQISSSLCCLSRASLPFDDSQGFIEAFREDLAVPSIKCSHAPQLYKARGTAATRTARMISTYAKCARFETNGRTPWVLNKDAARLRGQNI